MPLAFVEGYQITKNDITMKKVVSYRYNLFVVSIRHDPKSFNAIEIVLQFL